MWNLFFDKKAKKIQLRIDRKNLPSHFIPEELHQLLAESESTELSTILVDKYVVIAPTYMDYTNFMIYYLEVDQLKGWVLGKAQKIRLKIAQEWQY